MAINIAINGFGRIGRLVFRAAIARGDINILAINDIVPADNLAYLLKYDSTHGRFKGEVRAEGNTIIVNGKTIHVLSEKDPEKLPWRDLHVDYVIESTGLFTSPEAAGKH
jgi:glyceraldehyde 3-phosphate dehydrogenase